MESSTSEKEINLESIIYLIIRNRYIVLKFTLIFTLLGCLFAITRKRIWEGNFEIVLNSPKERSLLYSSISNSNLSDLIDSNLNSNSTSLQTEIGILESPSVLLPVFNFLNSEIKKNDTNIRDLDFSIWRKKTLNVALKKRTTILNISYKDNNKEYIIPVLNRISKTYQTYSGLNKKRSISVAKDYLEKQINIYRIKSSDSIRDAQEYAISKDLAINSFGISDLQSQRLDSPNPDIKSNIGIENIRLNEANKIKKIDLQIAKINELDENDFRKIQYVGSTIPQILEEGLPAKLEELESELAEIRSKYTDNDINVKSRLETRKILITLLKNRALGYLEAQKLESEALMESVIRPKNVLLRYKELLRKAARDEKTLFELENQMRVLSLEEAKKQDPWKLISEPTLKKYPVAPSRRKIVILFFLAGFGLGSSDGIFKEKRSGFIYEEKELVNLLSSEVLEKINIEENIFRIYDKNIFKNEILNVQSGNNYKFITSREISLELSNKLLSSIFDDKKDYDITNNLSELNIDDQLILITSLGKITKEEVSSLSKRLIISNKKLFGIILIENKI